MAKDLKDAFPDISGFSPRNIKYMRKFAECWLDFEHVKIIKGVKKAGHICLHKNADPKDIEMRDQSVLKYIELKINTNEDVEYEKIKDFLSNEN